MNDSNLRPAILSPDVIDLLLDMGLTEREVQIYEFLLKRDGAIPSAIAHGTGQPRGRIYEGMRNLVAKGFARERPTRPILFCPTPIVDVLSASRARLGRHLVVVRRAQTAAAAQAQSEIKGLSTRQMKMADVSVLGGRRACNAEILRMLDASSKFFWIAGGTQFAERLANMPIILDGAKAAAARGVDVRIIFPKPKVMARGLALVDLGRPQPILFPTTGDLSGPVVSCASDIASLELTAQPDNEAPHRGDDVAIYIADALFAERTRHRLSALMVEPSGPTPPVVYPWLGPNHGSDIFAEGIKRATREVQVLGPAEWGTYLRSNWAEHSRVYDTATNRGVVLRAVASRDAAAEADMMRFQRAWKIRVVPQLPMWLTILDGKEFYQAFPHPSLGGAPQFRRSEEPNELRFYQGVFERLWNEGLAPVQAASARPQLVPTP